MQKRTTKYSIHEPRDAFLPHLSAADRLLRSDALEHAQGVVSQHLDPNVRRSRIARRTVDTIVGEKGWHFVRPEDVAKEWSLDVHPRDLDGAVYQDEWVSGRRLLDYGDLPTYQPTTLLANNPFVSRAPVTIKEEEVDVDADSTTVQPSEQSTTYAEVDENDKENGMEWNHITGWQAGLKRKAHELIADHDEEDQGPENEPKRVKFM